MKTMIANVLTLVLLLTGACAQAPDDNHNPPPYNTGGTGGTGGVGGTGGTTPAPTSDVRWAKAGSVDVILINGMFCKNTTATLVGDCRVEGTTWTSGKRVTKDADGWFPVTLTGGNEECHVNLMDCSNDPIIQADNTSCGGTWGNFGCQGQPSAPGTGKGGGYAWCGNYLGGPFTCNIAFRRHPGALPDFFGSNPPVGP